MGDKLTEGMEALGFLPLTPNLAAPELYSKLEAEVRESVGSALTMGASMRIELLYTQLVSENWRIRSDVRKKNGHIT